MNFSKILLTSALALLAMPAMAQDAPKSDFTKDVAAQSSGKYTIDGRHTSVIWKVMHMNASNYTARFDKVDAELNFDSKDPTKSTLKVTIPTSSVNTGLADFDKEIGKEFLGGGDITFVSTSVKKTDDDEGQVTGNLTMNGVTKPVTLDVDFNGGFTHPMKPVRDLGFSAETKIKRSDFNVAPHLPTAVLGDEIEIEIETEFFQDIPAKK